MRTAYPSLMYNNEKLVSCTVENELQRKCLEGYFKDELNPDHPEYSEIHIDEAMRIHKDAKVQTQYESEHAEVPIDASEAMEVLRNKIRQEIKFENAKKGREIKAPESVSTAPDAIPEKKDTKSLKWNELRAYGKELEKAFGVEIPLGATRDIIEKSINEVLNGDDYRRRSEEVLPKA